MDHDVFKGKWKQLKGRVREKWGELTQDEVDQIQGKKEILSGKLQEKYGMTKDQAENEINSFLEKINV
ncbi:MAG TPA: CsbD family protein [Anaerolineales bacterium]|nr:CsbD family protein [Anaerolineales bacterium]